MIDAIIFDFDGVILDSEPMHYEACCIALKNLGLVLDYKEYKNKYLGKSDKDMMPELLLDKGYSLSLSEIEELIGLKVSTYSRIIESSTNLPMFPDFDTYLFMVAEKIDKIAICSGSSRSVITTILEKLGHGIVQSIFKTIISCEDVQFGKPSAEGYLLAAKELNCIPERCFVIEDAPPGIKAARDAGMRVAGILTTYDREHLSEAHILVNDFKDLITKHNIFCSS